MTLKLKLSFQQSLYAQKTYGLNSLHSPTSHSPWSPHRAPCRKCSASGGIASPCASHSRSPAAVRSPAADRQTVRRRRFSSYDDPANGAPHFSLSSIVNHSEIRSATLIPESLVLPRGPKDALNVDERPAYNEPWMCSPSDKCTPRITFRVRIRKQPQL